MKTRRRPAAFGCAALLALALAAPSAAAADDGIYNRLDGDLDLRVGAGVAFGEGGPSFAATAAAVYLSSAGLYVHYADALGSDAPNARRSLSTGIHLQPVFLARYASNGERGPAHLDLFVDSFAFELGAFWQAPRGRDLGDEPGLEVGLTCGVPILASANGPWLEARAALRWRAEDQRGPGVADAFDRGALLTLTAAFHHTVGLHLVDAGDALRR